MQDVARPAKALFLLAIVIAAGYLIDSRETNSAGGLLAPAQRRSLPDMTIHDLDGKIWRQSDHRGEVVLVNFWASWCPPCREETPALVHLATSYSQGELDVIGVSMDEGRTATVRQFVSEYQIPYTIAQLDRNFELSSAIEALPTTLLIDKRGCVAKKYVGATSERVFRADINSLLHEQIDE